MNPILALLAALFVAVLFLPWLLAVTAPFWVAAGLVATAVATLATLGARRLRPAIDTSGILALGGFDDRPALAPALERSLGRVLGLAPDRDRAHACACVKPSDGRWVGVLRVDDDRGHYLLRESGATRGAVGRELLSDLDRTASFPVRSGRPRIRCPECLPANCPLRGARRGFATPLPA